MVKKQVDNAISNGVKAGIEEAVQDVLNDGAVIDGIIKRAMMATADAYREHATGVKDRVVNGLEIAIAQNDMREVKRITNIFKEFEFSTCEGLKP